MVQCKLLYKSMKTFLIIGFVCVEFLSNFHHFKTTFMKSESIVLAQPKFLLKITENLKYKWPVNYTYV